MCYKKKILLVLFTLIFTCIRGQFKSTSSIGGNYSQGNTGLMLGSLQSVLQFDSTKFYANVSPYFCYSQVMSGGQWVTKQRESYLTTSFLRKFDDVNFYVFTDVENSLQKKFNLRASVGVGLGKYIENKNIRISTSLGVMPEYYSSFSNQIEKSLRLSLRLHIQTKGKMNFSTITLIQPAILMDPFIGYKNNFNLRSTNNFSVPISKTLSVGLQVLVTTSTLSEYTSTTIKATDITSSFIITYSK